MTERAELGNILEIAVPEAKVMLTLQAHRGKPWLRELHDELDAQYKICKVMIANESIELKAEMGDDNLVRLFGDGEEIILERGHKLNDFTLRAVTNHFVASCQIGTKIDRLMYEELKSGHTVRMILGKSGYAQIVN